MRFFETFRLRCWLLLARFLPGTLMYWLPRPRPFEPRAIDQDAARQQIENWVVRLAPEAVDECTGHVMDRLINVWADAWVAELTVECQRHGLECARIALLADALAARQAVLSRDAVRRHDEMLIAHEAAVRRLCGTDQSPPNKSKEG